MTKPVSSGLAAGAALGMGTPPSNRRLQLLARWSPSCPQLLLFPGVTKFQSPQMIKIWGILRANFVLEIPWWEAGKAIRIKLTPAGLWENHWKRGGAGQDCWIPVPSLPRAGCRGGTPRPPRPPSPARLPVTVRGLTPWESGRERGRAESEAILDFPPSSPMWPAGDGVARESRSRASRADAAGSGALCGLRGAKQRPRREPTRKGVLAGLAARRICHWGERK